MKAEDLSLGVKFFSPMGHQISSYSVLNYYRQAKIDGQNFSPTGANLLYFVDFSPNLIYLLPW